MSFLGAWVVDRDFGPAFGIEVWVGTVVHHFAGEGDHVSSARRGVVVAAGTESGGVVRHVAFVGIGDNGKHREGDGGGFHADGKCRACGDESLRLLE